MRRGRMVREIMERKGIKERKKNKERKEDEREIHTIVIRMRSWNTDLQKKKKHNTQIA